MGLFHHTGGLGPLLCPYFQMAALGGFTAVWCDTTAFVPAAGFACRNDPAWHKRFSLGAKTITGAILQAEARASPSANRGLRGARASLPPSPPLQTLGEGPLGQGKCLHSRWVMSGRRGAGTAVSRHPAATPGLGPGAREEREGGDTHSWGTGVTLPLPSLPVRFPRGLVCGGFYWCAVGFVGVQWVLLVCNGFC